MKSGFQLVDEEEQAEHEPKPEPQGEGEEYDIERAIRMSLESFQATGQVPVGDVAIREPPKKISTTDQYIFQRRIPMTEEPSTGPSTQPEDDTFANIVHDTSSPTDVETVAETDNTNSKKDTEILNIGEEQGEDVTTKFFNDKPTEEEPDKSNMETKVESMVTVLIHQASSSIPPISTPVIDLTPPKPVSLTIQVPIFTATTTTTTTTLPLPPPIPQQPSSTDLDLASRLSSRVFNLELHDLPHKIDETVCEAVKVAVHMALQAPFRDRFRELPEADMKEIIHQRMFESGTYKSLPKHVALYEALEASMERGNRDEFLTEKDKSRKRCHDDQDPPLPDSDLSKKKRHDSVVEDVPIPDDMNISDSEDTNTAHLPKIKTRPDWLKPVREEHRPASPEPDWFQMEECHLLLTDQVDLVNLEGHRVVLDVSKPSPLGGPPGRRSALSISKLKAARYLDFGLKELVPSLWIKSEREYDISAAYGISHWWFKRKELYIIRHSSPSDHSTVRSYMRILSVVSLKTNERYEYALLKEIVLHRADYNEYKISEADFKNLHPNDFEDLYLLHLQDLQLGIESYQMKLNLTQPDWDASDFLFKEDYTIVSKPRAVIYRDRNDQKKLMQETEVHKFSDGMLNRILDKDHMVKDFKLFKYNPSMETRIWSEDDRRRSKQFMEVIERRLKIRRIFRNIESFVGGRLRDVDYRLIQRTE
ncbi:hypothetical protein Tco_1210008 [Tanacetum coccineum]